MALVMAAPVGGATVGVPEGWSGGSVAGWVSYDLINQQAVSAAACESGSLKLTFAAQSIKTPPEKYLLKADTNASCGTLTGDYIAGGVMAVRFRVYCPMAAEVMMRLYSSKTDRLWRYAVTGLQTGEWVSVTVPVDPKVLHGVNGVQGWTAFAEDLRNIDWVGVSIRRNDSVAAQAYRIDDFELLGPGPAFAQWMSQFGGGGDERADSHPLAGGDLDGDGVSNIGEWVAGTSAGDSREYFEVKVDAPQGTGMPLRWASVAGRRYVVLRSANLTEGFGAISGPLDAAPPENQFRDTTATGAGPYFYRVQVLMDTP